MKAATPLRAAYGDAEGLVGLHILWASRVETPRAMTETTAGDADRLAAAVHEHARLLYRLAYSVVRNRAAAEDVVQETFVRALRARTAISDVRSARAWLMKIAWNAALDYRRSASARGEVPAEVARRAIASGASAEHLASSRELLGMIERLIPTLPRKLRRALVLSTIDGLSSAEVAELLGIPEHSVRTRVMRARQLLKQKLAARLKNDRQEEGEP